VQLVRNSGIAKDEAEVSHYVGVIVSDSFICVTMSLKSHDVAPAIVILFRTSLHSPELE